MNLYNIGLSGMLASQARLAVTGHNIANVDTAGYNRQSVLASTAGARGTTNGFFGRGVMIDSVRRSHDSFLYRQLTFAQGKGASLVAQGNQLQKVDSVLADRTVGVAPAINRLFDALDAVASAPADPAARQELIGQASGLVTQMNELAKFLENQADDINTAVSNTVADINSYAERIRDLNQQIINAKASNPGQPPNDLYDQREQLVAEMNQLVGVTVTDQNDVFSLSIANGQTLLSGDKVYPLQAKASAADPHKVVVAYTTPTSTGGTRLVELKDEAITGGSLGGLMQFRNESLVPLQNRLGRMAVGLAQKFNELHRQGVDLNGVKGGDFFKLGHANATVQRDMVMGIPNEGNNVGFNPGHIGVSFRDVNKLTDNDYSIEFDGTRYTIKRMPDGVQVYKGTGVPAAEFDGLRMVRFGQAKPGDRWELHPTRDAARDLKIADGMTDPAKIAASSADNSGTANGENALKLAKLRNEKIMGNGTLSVNEAFSQLVNKSAVQSQQVGSAAKAQANLISLNYASQQAVSGVNAAEEEMNLLRYQAQFRAAAQIIDAGTKVFDTLLDLRQ